MGQREDRELLLVRDRVTNATITAKKITVLDPQHNRRMTIRDQRVIRALYEHDTAQLHGDGSYMVHRIALNEAAEHSRLKR